MTREREEVEGYEFATEPCPKDPNWTVITIRFRTALAAEHGPAPKVRECGAAAVRSILAFSRAIVAAGGNRSERRRIH